MMTAHRRPLAMHVVNRFDVGGLENGVVNLINLMPEHQFRHMVVSLTEVTDFRRRLQRDDVVCVALHKPPGHGLKLYPAFRALLAEHRPAIVHTRNLGPLEMQPVAAWAGVPARIHSEHGREIDDLFGTNRKYRWLRRAYAPFVHRQVALSLDLQRYLVEGVGIPAGRVEQIYNGVDTQRFHPVRGPRMFADGCPFDPVRTWCVGTVGRMQGVKNPVLLARAFVRALELAPWLRPTLRLMMIGDGPVRSEVQALLASADAAALAWLPGERNDVPNVMRSLDCFVLPSLAEGISNTILEAMACGLPVVATAVGGNPELVRHGRTGEVVPTDDVEAMAAALVRRAEDPKQSAAWGAAGLLEVERRFSLQAMVQAYVHLYTSQLAVAGIGPEGN